MNVLKQEKVIAIGLEDFTVEEVSTDIHEFMSERLNFVDSDFKISQISLVGSRLCGNHRKDSDLDVAFQYEGRYRSDVMCDTLNENPLVIEGIHIDFVPYSSFKGEVMDNESLLQNLLLPANDEDLIKFDKDRIISWMESGKQNGAFEGFPENNMDFKTLSNKELEHYFYEWAYEDMAGEIN